MTYNTVPKIKEKCKVLDCEREKHTKGYCQRHYKQINKYGMTIGNPNRIMPKKPNKYFIYGDIYKIELYDNLGNITGYAIIDIDDIAKVAPLKWSMNIDGYIASQFDGKHFKLHRIILGVENSDVNIDHINGDKSDNRKINLRLCTYMQNNHNQKLAKNNNSGYKGVYFRSKTSKWEANISFNYKRYHLGVFNSKEEAAQAYNKAAIKYYGEFANLNKITQDYVIATCQ